MVVVVIFIWVPELKVPSSVSVVAWQLIQQVRRNIMLVEVTLIICAVAFFIFRNGILQFVDIVAFKKALKGPTLKEVLANSKKERGSMRV